VALCNTEKKKNKIYEKWNKIDAGEEEFPNGFRNKWDENNTMMNKQVILITDKSSLNVLTVEMKHIKGLKLAFPAFVCWLLHGLIKCNFS
jgi:hypothetical protein